MNELNGLTLNNGNPKHRIAIFGASGYGKSFYIKNSLIPLYYESVFKKQKTDKKGIYVWDVQNEYLNNKDYQLNINHEKKFEPDFNKFAAKHADKVNSLFIIDEAAVALTTREFSKDTQNWFINARHDNNYFVFVYQGFNLIPNFVALFMERLIIFKTGDSNANVKKKFNNDKVILVNEELNKRDEKKLHYIVDVL